MSSFTPPSPVKLGLHQVREGQRDMASLLAVKTNRAEAAFIGSVIRAPDNVLKGTAASSASRDLLVETKPGSSPCEPYFKSLAKKGAGWQCGFAPGGLAQPWLPHSASLGFSSAPTRGEKIPPCCWGHASVKRKGHFQPLQSSWGPSRTQWGGQGAPRIPQAQRAALGLSAAPASPLPLFWREEETCKEASSFAQSLLEGLSWPQVPLPSAHIRNPS